MKSTIWVYTMSRLQGGGSWSYYELPIGLQAFCVHEDELLVRDGDTVYRVERGAVQDEVSPGVFVPFGGEVRWSFLDMGRPGANKELGGFDIVSSGNPVVSFGYDQRDENLFTEPVAVPADSVPDMVIPFTATAASFSPRVTYDGSVAWSLEAMNLYLIDRRQMS